MMCVVWEVGYFSGYFVGLCHSLPTEPHDFDRIFLLEHEMVIQ